MLPLDLFGNLITRSGKNIHLYKKQKNKNKNKPDNKSLLIWKAAPLK